MSRQKLCQSKNQFQESLETSLIHLGTSPDMVGPLKEAVLEAQSFPLNLIKSESKLLGDLEISFLDQYANFIPFLKALERQILDS